MGDETPVTTLILPVLIRPILSEVRMFTSLSKFLESLCFDFLQLEKHDVSASQTLRSALTKAEAAYPGLAYDLVVGMLRKGDLTVNMNESILRLQGAVSDSDGNVSTIQFAYTFIY